MLCSGTLIRPTAILVVILTYVYAVAASLVHTSIHRTIDLSSSGSRVVQDSFLIHLTNTDDHPVHQYQFLIPAVRAPRLASISALQSPSTDGSTSSKILSLINESIDDHFYAFVFQLASPITSSLSSIIKINLAFMDDIRPLPHTIAQSEPQRMVFSDSLDMSYLPFPTKQVKVSIKLPTQKDPISYSNHVKPITLIPGTIVYGPQDPSQWADKNQTLHVHFDSHKVGLISDSWRREVWVRMFGASVEVEEHVKVTYDGARLKGHFSRLEYMKSYMDSDNRLILPQFPVLLPKTAREVYCKDEIGNVSTSRVSDIRGQRILEVQPRYPLLGGWTYNWFHGYAMDGTEVVTHDSNSGRTTVTVPMVLGIPSVAIRSLEFKLVLPEGASDIIVLDARTGKPVNGYDMNMTYYYFDSTGRPTVTLHRTNVINEAMWESVAVSYTLHPLRRIQKPLAVISFVIILYSLIIIVRSIDLTIVKRDQHVRRLLQTFTNIDRVLAKLRTAISTYRNSNDIASLRNSRSLAAQVLSSSMSGINKRVNSIHVAAKEPGADHVIQMASKLLLQAVDLVQERQETVLEAVDLLLSVKDPSSDSLDVAFNGSSLLIARDDKVALELRSILQELCGLSL